MRKISIYALLLTFIILQGCATDNESNSAEEVNGQASQEEMESNQNSDLEEQDGEEEDQAGNVSEEEETQSAADSNAEESKEVEKEYQINESTWTVDPITDADPKVALLTIDDAPDANALKIAQTLKKLDVSAIFFVNGHLVNSPEKEEVIKEIYDLGFAIGNHTYSHSNLKDLTEEEQKEEILKVNDMVEDITGERPRFFRAPFGSNTDYSKGIAAEENMTIMNWTYGYDWEKEYQTREAIADIMVNTPYLSNGANLLMHDRTWTMEAMEDIVKGLQQKGYSIVNPDAIK
ncbi:polysaccharide deacetylase family protein [Cytobacillus gottheilii]|uniref:polysaccharide deacetylase family protein n=1 Tax=Cytobacillus gottheilii TaxID=859144 RepID=UPI0009BC419F|nr:polysaccharide deacetylase family protein [Cytobacillus gottheilii]